MVNPVKAYGSFTRLGSYVFRTKAHLQFGSSVEPIGVLYMLNPGESRLEDKTLWDQLMVCPENNTSVTQEGQLILDDTMEAVREILNQANPQLEGILPIVNLFNLRHGKAEDAIKVYEEIYGNENYLKYIHSPLPDLQGYPWVWLAWTVADRASLNPRKQEVIEHVKGKHQFAIYSRQPKHQSRKHLYAYHPNPRVKEDRERYFVEMVGMMRGYRA